MNRHEAGKRQQNKVKLGVYTLNVSPNKPKKCESCGSRSKVSIYVRNRQGTVGTVTYCTECDAMCVNVSEKAQFNLNWSTLSRIAQNLAYGGV